MSESIWAAVIGGVATIVAAVITVWATRTGPRPPPVPTDKPPNIGTKPPAGVKQPESPGKSPAAAGEPTEFGHRRIWKEMRNGAVLEEREGKPVLHKDGVDLLYPQRRTISGMENGGFLRQETAANGAKKWLLP